MKTRDNLKDAFAGESQANRKYLAYGERAAKDGHSQVAKLFRAVAAAETVHAHAHLKAMGGVAGTLENLEDARAGEAFEVEEMYPPMLAAATEEGETQAERSISNALEVEKTHHRLFGEAIEAVKAGADLPEASIHVCPICGHTVIGGVPDQCPMCMAKGASFSEIS